MSPRVWLGAASNNASGGAFTNANSFGNYSIAGGLAAQAGIYLDGTPVTTIQGNPAAFIITQDAVQEFRVESSVVNPQYGHFGGGVISFGTKSGGEQTTRHLLRILPQYHLQRQQFLQQSK